MALTAAMFVKEIKAMNDIHHSVADPLPSNFGSCGAGILWNISSSWCGGLVWKGLRWRRRMAAIYFVNIGIHYLKVFLLFVEATCSSFCPFLLFLYLQDILILFMQLLDFSLVLSLLWLNIGIWFRDSLFKLFLGHTVACCQTCWMGYLKLAWLSQME